MKLSADHQKIDPRMPAVWLVLILKYSFTLREICISLMHMAVFQEISSRLGRAFQVLLHGDSLSSFKDDPPVVTGIGIVSPIGIGVKDYWEATLGGFSGEGDITRFSTKGFPVKKGFEVKDWDIHRQKLLTKREIQMYALPAQFAVAAARLAIEDSGLQSWDPNRMDVVIGEGAEPHGEIHAALEHFPEVFLDYEPGKLNPLVALRMMNFAPAAAVCLALGAKGEPVAVSTACTSTFTALGITRDRLALNKADVIISGGTEATVNRPMLQAMLEAKMINPDSDGVFPLDLRATKPGVGEGSSMFVVEPESKARARNARIYCRIVSVRGGQENRDTKFSTDKSGARWAEIFDGAIDGRQIDAINVHAPGDQKLDRLEAKALRRTTLKEDLREIPVWSGKAGYGSGLASSSSFETAATCLALYHQVIPPTVGYKVPDEEIDLSVSGKPKKGTFRFIAQNHKALGGNESTMVLEACK